MSYDIPILLEFYARVDKFIHVFNAVKKMKPKYLYLYQDAPRSDKDKEGWKACRDLVNSIDWDCEVHTYYQEKNQGCDPSGFLAQSWFFSNVEYGIVLEDDCVPNESFFLFMKECLIKYKDDKDIAYISGMNILDKYDNKIEPGTDYFFSKFGSTWGWGSWKRFYKNADSKYSWLDDEKKLNEIINDFSNKKVSDGFINLAKSRQKENKEYFETILTSNMRLHHQVAIVPTQNMISNIGIGDFGTHSASSLKRLHPKVRKMFYKTCFDYEFPLKHPTLKTINKKYEIDMNKKAFPRTNFSYKYYAAKYEIGRRLFPWRYK